MKEGSLMLCKIQSGFICFCKPSAAPRHIYTLKLETVAACKQPLPDISNDKKKAEGVLKSCIRNPQDQDTGKKSVQWMDKIAEIKEFESRGNETSSIQNEEEHSRRCVCIIL